MQKYLTRCTSERPVCYICRMSTQRTIKFRAWHSGEACMIDWDFIIDDGILPYFRDEAFILMQYTGLRDKDGREIYEGDVVNGYNGLQFEVGWDPEDAAWNMGSHDASRMSVIGNIYENPELTQA